jgi:hypothetical protein
MDYEKEINRLKKENNRLFFAFVILEVSVIVAIVLALR